MQIKLRRRLLITFAVFLLFLLVRVGTRQHSMAQEQPPMPPAHFSGPIQEGYGFVPEVGMTIQARINSRNCGQSQLFVGEGGAIEYELLVDSDYSNTPGCGTPGATIVFVIIAGEQEIVMTPTGVFDYGLILDLPLAPAPPTPTPITTPTPPPATSTPPPETPTPVTTPTLRPPTPEPSAPPVIPEPFTLTLFGIGLAALSALRTICSCKP